MALNVRRGSLAALVVLLAIVAGPAVRSAQAQYFGRNKVEYKSFKFQVLKTEHFDIYYYKEEEAAAEQAGRMAERWYARLSRILDHELRGRQPLILYASQPDFTQTTAIPGDISEGTGGVTQIIKRRIVLPLAGPLAETDHVIGHELVHAFQFDITGEGGTGPVFEAPGAARLPLWFIEGMAEYLSLGSVDANTAMWMRDAALNDRFPSIRDLDNPRYFPYRYGQALWAYIGGRWDDEVVGRVLKLAGQSGDAIGALTRVLEVNVDSLSQDWKQATVTEYEPLGRDSKPAQDYGRSLITHRRERDTYNLAPSLSPDGKRLVFLSERSLYSMDMYLANAETGAIDKKIVSTALNAHFESLEFINSAGAWHPDGHEFVFAAISGGKPVLEILSVERGKIEREIKVPQVDEIYTPSYSPDGQRIVFSANVGGWLDLYLLDLESGEVQRLTNDAHADLEPAWSPDGGKIAFVTDRFGTNLADLSYGNYRLALLDAESGVIEPLGGFERAKNIDPQWAPDGTSLYFISDPDGISNVYRLDLDSGQLFRITRLLTGVSGITPLSPALSVARETGSLAYSVYERSGYDLYTIDSGASLAGELVSPQVPAVKADVLPPQSRQEGLVLAALGDQTTGLPADTSFSSAPYHAGLSLDYIGDTYVGVGTGRFGTLIGGGSSLYWSDMLGRRNLVTLLQINGGLKDVGALAAYQNLTHRWNWEVSASQIPFLTGAYSERLEDVDGQLRVVDRTYLFRQTNRQVAGIVQYPFSRAQRVEFAAGYTNVSFSSELETQVYTTGGQQIKDTKQDLPGASTLNLAEASAALVYDNALFGNTSPILGQRYRLEVSPILGSLNLVNALADYRRYVVPVWPVTVAVRALHYGRWGGDAEDDRLSPLFIGYQPLVRGYDVGSFDVDECVANATSGCPVFDQLFGSRMLIGNLEVRLPLLGGIGLVRTPALPPVDLAGFFDAGVAWWGSTGEVPAWGISRVNTGLDNPVSSYGAALRMNLYGFAVLELDVVHPNDRPGKGWHLQFGFTPGF